MTHNRPIVVKTDEEKIEGRSDDKPDEGSASQGLPLSEILADSARWKAASERIRATNPQRGTSDQYRALRA